MWTFNAVVSVCAFGVEGQQGLQQQGPWWLSATQHRTHTCNIHTHLYTHTHNSTITAHSIGQLTHTSITALPHSKQEGCGHNTNTDSMHNNVHNDTAKRPKGNPPLQPTAACIQWGEARAVNAADCSSICSNGKERLLLASNPRIIHAEVVDCDECCAGGSIGAPLQECSPTTQSAPAEGCLCHHSFTLSLSYLLPSVLPALLHVRVGTPNSPGQ